MLVYVAIYTWPNGEAVRVYASRERANQAKQETADEWWDSEMTGHPKPDDPVQAAREYFAIMSSTESFQILECSVVGHATPEGDDDEA